MWGVSIFKNHFVQSSVIVGIGSFLVNGLNYVFNMVMGRLLTPSEFGEVVFLFGFLFITAVPATTLITLIAKYTSTFKTKNQPARIAHLFNFMKHKSIIVGLLSLLLFLILTPFLAGYFNTNILALLIFAFFAPFTLLSALNMGVLQGLQQFVPFSLVTIIATSLKFVLAIAFVLLGFSVPGVMAAFIIGLIASYFYGTTKARSHMRYDQHQTPPIQWKDIAAYASVVFWALFLLAIFTNIDLILAKHYLTPYIAGQYSALSLLGKIITFGTAAFIVVMFPKVSSAHTSGDSSMRRILLASLGIISLVSTAVILVYSFFPELVIRLLFGTQYLSVGPYLVWYAGAMGMGAIATLLIHYFMAVHALWFLYPLIGIVLLEIVLLMFFHTSIAQFSQVVFISNVALLLGMGMAFLNQKKFVIA